jgi:hypothetical protein
MHHPAGRYHRRSAAFAGAALLPLLALFPLLLPCGAVGLAEESAAAPQHPADLLTWRSGTGNALSLRSWLATDLRAFPRTEVDYGRSWHVEPSLVSARVSSRFRLWQVVRGRLDLELAEASPDVQEAWFEYRPFELFGLRAGRAKVPFGLAPQLSVPDYRLLGAPMVFGNSKDFRDAGFLVLGDWKDGFVGYAVGAVLGSRDVAVDVNDKPDLTGRILLHAPADAGNWLSGLHVGTSATWGEGPTRHGFRGRTLAGHSFLNPPSIRGEQLRLGAEVEYATPWFRLAGEYTRTVQQRDGIVENQKVGKAYAEVADLEDYAVSGWYSEASVHLFGKRALRWAQADGSDVEGQADDSGSSLAPRSGLELCGRFETLDVSDGHRLVEVDAGNEDHAPLADTFVMGITAGINYYFEPGIRLTLAWQGLRFDDATLAADYVPPETADEPAAEPGSAWTHQLFLRAQLSI